MKRILILVTALVAVGSPRAATPPSGGLRATGVGDLLLNKRKPRWYNEIWAYQFLFDNGTQATLNYTYAKLGFKDPVCGADFSVAGFKGRNYSVGREYPENRFQQQANPLRIQIHPDMWLQGLPPASHRVHFATNKNEGYFLDLEFSRMVPGVVWGDGAWSTGNGDMTLLLPIPSARVKGRIGVGRDTIHVEGWAVLEHNRQTALVADIVKRSFRGFVPGDHPVYLNAFQEKGGAWTGFALQWSGGVPKLVAGGPVGVQSLDGRQPPQAVSVSAPDQRSLVFKRANVAQSASILDGMEGVTRWVVKQFVGDVQIARGRLEPAGFYQYVVVK